MALRSWINTTGMFRVGVNLSIRKFARGGWLNEPPHTGGAGWSRKRPGNEWPGLVVCAEDDGLLSNAVKRVGRAYGNCGWIGRPHRGPGWTGETWRDLQGTTGWGPLNGEAVAGTRNRRA